MKLIIRYLFVALLINTAIQAQDIDIPDSLDFACEEDYKLYEPTIVKFIDWLAETPVDSLKMKRIMVEAVINAWGKGTPFTVFYPYTKVSNPIFKEIKKEYGREIYMSYYGGMIKYMINNPEEKDLVKVQTAGIKHLLNFTENNAMVLSSYESIAFYKELSYSGNLNEWINKKLNKKEKKGFSGYKPGDVRPLN